jgi:hypothetical protein
VLTAYTYAIDCKKIFLGFMAVVLTAVLLMVMAGAYREVFDIEKETLTGNDAAVELALIGRDPVGLDREAFSAVITANSISVTTRDDQVVRDERGRAVPAPRGLRYLFGVGVPGGVISNTLTLLNPWAEVSVDGADRGASLLHALFAFVTWFLLFWICTGKGGAISRITALEYARDELPTLSDGTDMVRARRLDFYMAPVTPLIGVVFMTACLALGGLVASIPWGIGQLLMVPGYLLCLIAGLVLVFLVVIGLLSFGLMMPAMAVNGKGAFDSWTAAYTYVIWGFSRFVLYQLLACIIGLVSVGAVLLLTVMLLGLVEASVDIGFVVSRQWMARPWAVPTTFTGVLAALVYFMKLAVLVVPLAYAFSYYWVVNTVIFMLLRERVDNVEYDEICEAMPEAREEGETELEIEDVEPGMEPLAEEDVTAPAEAALEEDDLEMDETTSAEPEQAPAETDDEETPAGEPESPQTSEAVEEDEAPAEEAAEPDEDEPDEKRD